ncbi:hypothetical protein [Pectobacterium carotovorum]|uniref:hypothetical protein n=1 Tax=Pectobacterium carotovorum TaxID=554 RepID=UPI00381DE334
METKFNGDASVKAKFIFFITHSQSYIIICAFLGMLCLLFGFYLTYKGFPFDRVCQPYFFAFVFIFISFFMANKTHKNIDLSDAKETEISISSSGDFKMITDVRASESLKNVSEILQVAANMHMLPKADGLLDDKLNVIPNSASNAEDLVNNLNKNARSECDDILAKLNRKKNIQNDLCKSDGGVVQPSNHLE